MLLRHLGAGAFALALLIAPLTEVSASYRMGVPTPQPPADPWRGERPQRPGHEFRDMWSRAAKWNSNVSYPRRLHRGWVARHHFRLHRFRYRGYASRGWRSPRPAPRMASPKPSPIGGQYLIAFSGIGGAIDTAAAQHIAAAQQRTLVTFGYRETGAAVAFLARQPGARHSVLGFSAGASASVLGSYMAGLRRAGVALPYSITTVGLYDRSPVYRNPAIPIVNFVDHSGQRHAGEPNVVNLGAAVSHLDPRTGAMARVAGLMPQGPASIPADVAALIPDDAAPPEQAVADARRYLIATAHPGGTMTRQGPAVAIGLLHPVFAVRLARAVRQARQEGLAAGLLSAYRPPAFGVGGFRDKFNSLHSYGLAVDMEGIGSPGSSAARRWYAIALANGIHGPYGPYNGAEWNHYQLVPTKIVTAGNPLRRTITGHGPIQAALMWLASGVGLSDVAPPPRIERPVIVARAHRPRHIRVRYAARVVPRPAPRADILHGGEMRTASLAPMVPHHIRRYVRRWHGRRG